jgi:hypothetical protein
MELGNEQERVYERLHDRVQERVHERVQKRMQRGWREEERVHSRHDFLVLTSQFVILFALLKKQLFVFSFQSGDLVIIGV